MAYCSQSDIEAIYGDSNVATWADLDNDGTPDAGRVTAIIANADAEIDAYLRGGRYVIPFASTPTLIVSLSAELAGAMLYDSRRVIDRRGSNDGVDSHRKHVYDTLMGIKTGNIRLSATEV